MSEAWRVGLHKHGVEYPSGETNHSLPSSSHVGGMRRVKHPRATLFTQVPPHIGLFGIGKEYVQLLAGTTIIYIFGNTLLYGYIY